MKVLKLNGVLLLPLKDNMSTTSLPLLQRMRDRVLFHLSLLWHSPKDYLYSFSYPTNKRIVLKSFDPQILNVVEKLHQEIETAIPELKVHFLGSASLGIDGVGDIDLTITTHEKKLTQFTHQLNQLFHVRPSKQRLQYIEWKFKRDGYPIEISFTHDTSPLYKRQTTVFSLLKNNPAILAEYKRLKESLNHSSIRNYHQQRMDFFNRILQNHHA